MISGSVDGTPEAWLVLRLRGPKGAIQNVRGMIDTGYTGRLALPRSIITALGLVGTQQGTAVLADGTTIRFNVYPVEVFWGHGWRLVTASEIGDTPLVGMDFLYGHRLTMDIVPGGVVEIVPIP